jgi:hypothetical protein
MKSITKIAIGVLLFAVFLWALMTTGCAQYHVHRYTRWSIISHERGGMLWDQTRTCTNCGYTDLHIETATKPKR